MATCTTDIRFFVLFFSVLLLVDVLAGVYMKSVFTTIERRFRLSTTKTALLSSAYQIGNLAAIIFVSYYGSRYHRPRFIAYGSVLVALGYLISSLPQFIGDRYEYLDATIANDSALKKPMCSFENSNMSDTACTDLSNSMEADSNLYIFIVAGTMLSGIGAAPLQPLGMSYIDDSAEARRSPVYIGIVMTISLIGPAFGFLLGSGLLQIWVDVGWVNISEITITPTDHNWVGAWWLGIVLCAILIGIATIPIFFFPKRMKIHFKAKESTLENDVNIKLNESNSMKPVSYKKGIYYSSKRICSDITFILLLVQWTCGGLTVVGIITYLPKYLEVQFGVSASVANMYYGAIGVPCLAVGTLLGSFIMKRLNPNLPGIAKIIMTVRVIATILGFSYFFIGCGTVNIVGVNVPFSDSVDGSTISAESSCNIDCSCNEGTYAPICGADAMSYVSACHAGCKDTVSTNPKYIQNYTDCSCINPSKTDVEAHWGHPGLCESTRCSHYVMLILGFVALSSLVGGIGVSPSYLFIMRTVPQKDKAFGIGLMMLIVRLLAWLPGPILYGKVIDSTCIYWAASTCGTRGNCRVYDIDSFRFRYFGVQSVAEIGATLCAIAIYIISKSKHKSSKDEINRKQALLRDSGHSRIAAARLASEKSESTYNL